LAQNCSGLRLSCCSCGELGEEEEGDDGNEEDVDDKDEVEDTEDTRLRLGLAKFGRFGVDKTDVVEAV
jgi:hypothetical protein